MSATATEEFDLSARGNARQGSVLGRLAAGFVMGYTAYVERTSRFQQIQKLNEKSDEELAEMGLTRDRIPAHVFSDIFYI